MYSNNWSRALIWLRRSREWLVACWLIVFAPQKFAALRSDRALAKDVERRWSEDSISVWCLVYERDDWKRYEKNQERERSNETPPDPTKRDFVVFLDPSYSVDWLSDGTNTAEAVSLIATAESLGSVDCGFLNNAKLQEYRLQIAQVIVCALQEEIAAGQNLLLEARAYLAKRTVEQSREWTLWSLLLLTSAVSALCFAYGRDWIQRDITNSFSFSLLGGFLGAFSSIAIKTGRGNWDAASGFRLHFLETAVRLSAGAIFGFIATSLASSAFGSEPIQSLVKTWQGYGAVAFGAGLFERSIPGILSKYTQNLSTEK